MKLKTIHIYVLTPLAIILLAIVVLILNSKVFELERIQKQHSMVIDVLLGEDLEKFTKEKGIPFLKVEQ